MLIRDQAHLLTELAYVVLNPIEAGMTADPLAWEWSSFRQTVRDGGRGHVPTARVLELVGRTPAEASQRLEAYVRDRMPDAQRVTVL